MSQRHRLVFSGSGGQGVITAAIIMAEAAVLHGNRNAVQTQVYGAAARGGASTSLEPDWWAQVRDAASKGLDAELLELSRRP